jgi:hypothetical protein
MTKDTTDEPKGKPLTREQKRLVERINAEAAKTIELLTSQFLNLLMESSDPEGPEMTDSIKSIDAKWRFYCKRKGLQASAYTIMTNYMNKSIEEYKAEKQGTVILEPEPNPV